MKVNLTRLLEVPSRVKYLNVENIHLGTGALAEIDFKTTSLGREYAFDLEDEEKEIP